MEVSTAVQPEQGVELTAISREVLVDVTACLLEELPLPASIAEELMHIAKTTKKIVVARRWWDTKSDCGCLVGTWAHEHGMDPVYPATNSPTEGYPFNLTWLGVAFPRKIQGRYSAPLAPVVDVVP